MRCRTCGEVHERCAAHVKNGERRGKPCRRWPSRGATVCRQCGGAAPQVKRAAELRRAEAEVTAAARRFLSEQGVDPLTDPLGALWQHVAEINAFYAFVREQVGSVPVEAWERRDAKGSPQLSVYVELFERAQDRTLKALAELVKLGVEERLAKLTERQSDAIVKVLLGALDEFDWASRRTMYGMRSVAT